MTEHICGHPTVDDGECQNPATEGDSCWIKSHGGHVSGHGRPKRLQNERRQQIVYTAVSTGLSVEDQAGLAQVHPDTLRRALCCVDTPREPALTTNDPCDFCEGYVQAHSRGALEVLQNCRPEYRASATFGYVKEEKRDVEHSGEGGGALEVTVAHDTRVDSDGDD